MADYENDPLMGFIFTNNGFATLFSLVKRANQRNWYQAIPKELPILIISGAEDPVGDFSKVSENSKAIKACRFSARDVTTISHIAS